MASVTLRAARKWKNLTIPTADVADFVCPDDEFRTTVWHLIRNGVLGPGEVYAIRVE